MFNLGPMELVVLAIVAIVVIGPEKLPKFAKDAASVLKTVRELATGARQQLRDELGPEFADIDLRNLNPRTAVQRVVFGDDTDGFREDMRSLDPRQAMREATTSYKASYASYADDIKSDLKVNGRANGHANGHANGVDLGKERPRPRPRPSAPSTPSTPPASYGEDMT